MVLNCERCKSQFTTEYLLQKHLNRKIPCNIIFLCLKCKKIFASKYSLERHYNNKKPCVEVPKYIKSVKKNINDKLKDKLILLEKQKEISIEIQKGKDESKLEIERERVRKKEIDLAIQKEKKILLEQKELAIKEEKRLKRKEARRIQEEKRDILEMEVQREAMLEFERDQRKIQLAIEKAKQIELKAQIQKDKARELKERKELEYSRAYQKTRDHRENIKLYAENNEKKIQKQKEAKLEIIKAKAESMKNIEVMRSERKEQTPQIINNGIIINNINICIDHIKKHHMDKLNIDFKQMQPLAIEYLRQNVISHDENKSAKFLVDIFEKYDTCNGILDHIIRMAYNNLELDDKRCIWYMKTPEYYFSGSVNKNEKIVKLIDFDKELFPLIKPMLSTVLIRMTAMVTKYVKMGCNYEEGGESTKYMKHQNLLYYQRNVLPFVDECLKDIRKMSNKVFEIESPAALPIIV
jgi:hypothetical protein